MLNEIELYLPNLEKILKRKTQYSTFIQKVGGVDTLINQLFVTNKKYSVDKIKHYQALEVIRHLQLRVNKGVKLAEISMEYYTLGIVKKSESKFKHKNRLRTLLQTLINKNLLNYDNYHYWIDKEYLE